MFTPGMGSYIRWRSWYGQLRSLEEPAVKATGPRTSSTFRAQKGRKGSEGDQGVLESKAAEALRENSQGERRPAHQDHQ